MMGGIWLGSFIIPFIAQHAIGGAGWRSAHFTQSLLAVLIPVPLNALLIREPRVQGDRAAAEEGLTPARGDR